MDLPQPLYNARNRGQPRDEELLTHVTKMLLVNVAVYVQTLYRVQSMLSNPPSDQKLNTLSDPGNYDRYFQTIKIHTYMRLRKKKLLLTCFVEVPTHKMYDMLQIVLL